MKYASEEVCQKALERWGKEAQLLMVLEEMAELQKEILKNLNRNKDNLVEIIDETTDVLIMLDQLQYIYGIEKAVIKHAPEKIEKIKARLGIK